MNKRLLSIFCVLVLLVSLTPVSAAFDLSYSSTPPLATLQMDGETTDYYSDLSGHQSDQDILLDLFQRTKGRTAQITLHKEVKVNTSLVIDDPDTCLTLELDSYGVDLYCTNHSVPLFKVTAGSLTLKGNGEFGASQGVYISGDNAKVVLNGTSIMPYADGTSTVGVGLYGSGSLQIINSHIGNLAIKENYQTGVLIQGGSASECSAVIDLSKNFAISGHTGISVEHGGSLVIKGNGRIVSNTQISNGIALKADQHSSVTLSGGRYMSTGTNGIAIKSEYPIGKMLVDGYAFYDYSSGMPLKDINVNDTSSSNSNDLLVKTVDENGPVAMVTTANGHMEQFFSSEYEGSDSAALTAAWEYADNGGASRLTLQRSIEYNASSPLQLNYNSDQVEPAANHDAKPCSGPKPCSSGQALYPVFGRHHDRSGPDKPDAGNHLRGHACRVKCFTVPFEKQQTDGHDSTCAYADKHIGSESCGTQLSGPFDSQNSAHECGEQEPQRGNDFCGFCATTDKIYQTIASDFTSLYRLLFRGGDYQDSGENRPQSLSLVRLSGAVAGVIENIYRGG